MPKQLFVVDAELNITICVMADDAAEAQKIARQNVRAEADEQSDSRSWHVSTGAPVTDIQCVPREWRDAYPYGIETTATIEMLLKGEKP